MIRIGQGFDVHEFCEGRPLILGGITIPYEKGLLGHSDADVLLHTISDALLGAIGEGDIGKHFPDTSSEWKGADSFVLLQKVMQLVTAHGYAIGNVDATIIAQKPKMITHIPAMKKRIAEGLLCDETAVNVKATTTEKLGFTGREEGIASMAVVLLVKKIS
ncbi:MAG: 2-C-methyl-D-erythritol 2,4-cyclodiphosphate synthase [Bacilli bacterium]